MEKIKTFTAADVSDIDKDGYLTLIDIRDLEGKQVLPQLKWWDNLLYIVSMRFNQYNNKPFIEFNGEIFERNGETVVENLKNFRLQHKNGGFVASAVTTKDLATPEYIVNLAAPSPVGDTIEQINKDLSRIFKTEEYEIKEVKDELVERINKLEKDLGDLKTALRGSKDSRSKTIGEHVQPK